MSTTTCGAALAELPVVPRKCDADECQDPDNQRKRKFVRRAIRKTMRVQQSEQRPQAWAPNVWMRMGRLSATIAAKRAECRMCRPELRTSLFLQNRESPASKPQHGSLLPLPNSPTKARCSVKVIRIWSCRAVILALISCRTAICNRVPGIAQT